MTKVYENTGGAFSEVPAGLTGVSVSSVAWGDYDNDGDLDILLTGLDSGYQEVAKVYENLTDPQHPSLGPRQPRRSLVRKRRHAQLGRGHGRRDAGRGTHLQPAGGDHAGRQRDQRRHGRRRLRLSTHPRPGECESQPELDRGRPVTAGVLERPGHRRRLGRLGLRAGADDGSATGVTEPALPRAYALRGIAPNPFNPVTTISFDLPQPARVKSRVFNIAGRLVRVLIDEERASGSQEVIWNGLSDCGQQVASGVYFCRIEAGSFRDTRRMTLLK